MARVIAELGINHNGQLDIVQGLIDMAKAAGADAVKFQRRTIDTVYAGGLENPRNDGNPYGWKTVGEQKRGLELSDSDFEWISNYCEKIGMPWFVSCWDVEMAEMHFRDFDNAYNKIASAMVTNLDFVREIASQKKYTYLSTGGSTWEQIDEAMAILREAVPRVCVMHCVSQYPCPDELLNLNMLYALRERYPWATIGYSGHEVGIYPSIMAIAMGARVVERHITMDRSMYGSDQAASMEYQGLKKLCDVAHAAHNIMGDGQKRIYPGEKACMKKLRYWE